MSRGLIFWVIMLVWLLFIGIWHFGYVAATYGPFGSVVLIFVLFALLGWQAYGPPIKG